MKNFKNITKLNKMQEECLALKGENIVIKAPTGCGKTIGALLNCKENNVYYYFLPTVTSCNIMYKTIKNYENIDVTINTSVMNERYRVPNSKIKIIIQTPDSYMIEFLKENKITRNCIFDELDSYPSMVRGAVLEYLKYSNKHNIVLSATLSDDIIKDNLSNFKVVDYKNNLKLLKHKIEIVHSFNIVPFIEEHYKANRKVGIICNSIKDINNIHSWLERGSFRKDIKILHSELTDYERLQVEDDLFNGNFKILLSNDIISYSIDIDFDVLIMQVSDKMNTNIQRMGRNNRRNKKIKYKNLALIEPSDILSCELPFIDEDLQCENFQLLTNDNNILPISYEKVNKYRKDLPKENIITKEEIFSHWEQLKEEGTPLSLREIYYNFVLDVQKEIIEIKDNKKIIKTINTTKTFKKSFIPFSRNPVSYDDILSILYINGQAYQIIQKIDSNTYKIIEIDEYVTFPSTYKYKNPYFSSFYDYENGNI